MDPPPIEAVGLTKRFGSVLAVDRVSFRVPRGAVYGFLGPNGSGKTTTLGMLTGLIPPDEGAARIAGQDVGQDAPTALGPVGALVEEPALYPSLSGRQNLLLLARLHRLGAIEADRALGLVGLSEAADQRYRGYSLGMKRRLGLASALLHDPQVLILDEPTNGLDPAGQLEVRRLLRELAARGRTILVSSHLLHEVQEVCTHAAILRKGRVVVEGTMGSLLSNGARIVVHLDDAARGALIARAVPGVVGAEPGDGVLLVDAPAEAAARVNRALVEAGLAVSGLAAESGGLEKRFLELTEGSA